MPNRYCNLVGTNKIKDEYTKINDGFDTVEQEMDATLAVAQAAQNTANAALPRTGGTVDGEITSRKSGNNYVTVATYGSGNPNLRLIAEGVNEWLYYVDRGDSGRAKFRNGAKDWMTLDHVSGEVAIYGNIRSATPAPRIYLQRTDTSNDHAGINAVNTDGSIEQYELLYDYVQKAWVIWDRSAGVGHKIWSAKDSGPFFKGSGSPEGSVTAPVGAIYQRTDGGASTTLYVKESGTGNTGWKAVQTA